MNASAISLNPKTGIGTADNADNTDGKGFSIRAATIISSRYFLSKLPFIRAIRVIRGSNFAVQVEPWRISSCSAFALGRDLPASVPIRETKKPGSFHSPAFVDSLRVLMSSRGSLRNSSICSTHHCARPCDRSSDMWARLVGSAPRIRSGISRCGVWKHASRR